MASHTLTHPNLIEIDDEKEIIRQIEEDRLALSELVGYDVVGFAYPGGGVNYSQRTKELIGNHTGIQYCRTNGRNETFDFPEDRFLVKANTSIDRPAELENFHNTIDAFFASKSDGPQLLFIMGHTYTTDYENDRWMKIESIFEHISKNDDIFYGTNREILLGGTYDAI